MNRFNNSDALAWAGLALDAELMGLRGAIERVLVDLQAIVRAGGDAERHRVALSSMLRDADMRAAAIMSPVNAGSVPPSCAPNPLPSAFQR